MTKTKAPKAPKKAPAPKAADNGNKLSMLDAAVKILDGQDMNCKDMIEQMAKRKLWTSPAGKTPHATLSAALLREIKVKGKEARFRKVGPGKFTLA
jgi:hypothetical protein